MAGATVLESRPTEASEQVRRGAGLSAWPAPCPHHGHAAYRAEAHRLRQEAIEEMGRRAIHALRRMLKR
jgi:hypothetical protein